MANTNVTISKTKVSIFGIEQRIQDFTHKFHVDYTDVNTGSGSSDTVTMAIGTSPAQWSVSAAQVYVTTAFAGTTAFTVQVGSTTTTTAFLSAMSVMTQTLLIPPNGPNSVNTPASAYGTSAVGLQALFTNATGGSPSALSAGALDIYLFITDLSRLDASTTG